VGWIENKTLPDTAKDNKDFKKNKPQTIKSESSQMYSIGAKPKWGNYKSC